MGLLKDVWVDKNNGEVIDAETDNLIAHTVIDLQDEISNVKTTADIATELAYTAQENIDIKVWPELENHQSQISQNLMSYSDLAGRTAALETDMGDVEAALDGIIAIQKSLMGVSE